MTSKIQSVSLFCTEGSSNKEYHIHLVQTDGGYVVNILRGPRGKALKAETKTPSPVAIEHVSAHSPC